MTAINKVLVAKKKIHKGQVHAWAEGGLPMLNLGYGYGLQIIADGSNFLTIQLFKHAIDEKVEQQTWARVKKVIVKKEVKVKPKKEPKPKIEFNIDEQQTELF